MRLEEVADEYETAEITEALAHDRARDHWFLIYAVAELCPVGQPPSPPITSNGYPQFREAIGSEITLYIRRRFVTPSEAVEFYRDPGNQSPNVTLAVPLRPFTGEGEPILIPSNFCENAGLGGVLPRRSAAMRVLSKYDTEARTRDLVTERCFPQALQILGEQLHIHFHRYPEHFGAVHLCFANPLLKRIDISLAADGRALLLRCRERMEKAMQGCEIEVANDWPPFGKGFSRRQMLAGPQVIVPLAAPPHRTRFRFFDPHGCCLEDYELGGFIGNISIRQSAVSSRQVKYQSEDGTARIFNVETITPLDPPDATPPPATSPQDFLAMAMRERELRDLEKARIFCYFSGKNTRGAAMQILRELIGEARLNCTIIDPYLETDDVLELVPSIRHADCRVRLLSSPEVLKKGAESRLARAIVQLRAQLQFQLEGRKMQGVDGPTVHDRFLQIDDRVYVLGSSINHFGERATVLHRLQRPEELKQEIERWWDNAKPLDEKEIPPSMAALVRTFGKQCRSIFHTGYEMLRAAVRAICRRQP
jgi:hypothetical protein